MIFRKEKIRIGCKSDGRYIMINDFSGTKIAYSFGIRKKVDWNYEKAKKGYDIFMYELTIKNSLLKKKISLEKIRNMHFNQKE